MFFYSPHGHGNLRRLTIAPSAQQYHVAPHLDARLSYQVSSTSETRLANIDVWIMSKVASLYSLSRFLIWLSLFSQIPQILSRSREGDEQQHDRFVHPEELRIIDDSHAIRSSSRDRQRSLPRAGQEDLENILEFCASPVSSVFSARDLDRRISKQKIVLRRPTISIQDDGKIIIGLEDFIYLSFF